LIRNRKIGPFLATMLVASNMVGSGIFLLPATLASVGSITLIGWGIGSVGALLIALVLAKLATIAPEAGGPCAYAGEAMGRYMGFQTTAVYWVSTWTGTIAVAVGATGYLASFFPLLSAPLYAAFATVGAIWLLTIVNIVGPRFVCQVETAAVSIGLIPIVLVAIGGWWFFDGGIFRASWNVHHEPALKAVPGSLVLLFWAFTGLEAASIATAVVENPRRNVPIATIGGVLVAAVLYTGSSTVIMGLIPADTLARSTAPFADAVRIVLGPGAAAFVALAALLKTLGTLGGQVLCAAQTGKAGADRGLLPAVLGRVDRAGIPVANHLLIAVLMSVFVFVTASPTLGEQFRKLIDVSTTLCLLFYVYACLSMWHYTDPVRDGTSAIRYRWIAALAMLFCLGVIAQSDIYLLAISAIVVFLTIPLYPFFKRPTQRFAE
jgi:arginine:agmatine antiporter